MCYFEPILEAVLDKIAAERSLDVSVLVDHQKLTFVISILILDAIKRTCQEWWMLRTNDERESSCLNDVHLMKIFLWIVWLILWCLQSYFILVLTVEMSVTRRKSNLFIFIFKLLLKSFDINKQIKVHLIHTYKEMILKLKFWIVKKIFLIIDFFHFIKFFFFFFFLLQMISIYNRYHSNNKILK